MDSDSRKYMTYKNGTHWWPQDVNREYKEKAKCFAQQYANYKIDSVGEFVSDLHLNDKLLLSYKLIDSSMAIKQ